MRGFATRWVTGLALLLAGAFASAARGDDVAPATDQFTGVWKVTVTPDSAAVAAGKQEFVDLILFEEGHLTASACSAYGFAPSAYGIENNVCTSTMAGDEGTIVWTAKTTSLGLCGRVTWTKPDGSVFKYRLRGARYTAPASDGN